MAINLLWIFASEQDKRESERLREKVKSKLTGKGGSLYTDTPIVVDAQPTTFPFPTIIIIPKEIKDNGRLREHLAKQKNRSLCRFSPIIGCILWSKEPGEVQDRSVAFGQILFEECGFKEMITGPCQGEQCTEDFADKILNLQAQIGHYHIIGCFKRLISWLSLALLVTGVGILSTVFILATFGLLIALFAVYCYWRCNHTYLLSFEDRIQ